VTTDARAAEPAADDDAPGADALVDPAVGAALDRLRAALPAGEDRPGQRRMADAVAAAIAGGRHLVVQAGTGTGKSFAYLVPAALHDGRVVVATATKALQDQLAHHDLPVVAEHAGRPLRWAVLKGRSNYLCRQRLREVQVDDDQLGLDGLAERAPREELAELVAWAATTDTGDRADLPFEPSVAAWSAVSVGPRECPGASRCPSGDTCFAERARHEAAAADVVVVNTHLYGLDLATDGAVLPDHDVVVVDEAHQLEEIVSATSGLELSAGRFAALARSVRAILDDDAIVDGVADAAGVLADALVDHLGRRLRSPLTGDLLDAVVLCRERVDRALAAVRTVPADGPGDVGARRERALQAAGGLVDDLDAVLAVPDTDVAWVEGFPDSPVLKVAPVDVSTVLRHALWDRRTAVLTSATVPPNLPATLGLGPDEVDELDAGSPFDHQAHALLYCPVHLPDPRTAGHEEAMHTELEALIVAAGGRTLALFTSWRAMDAAVERIGPRLPWRVLTQRELPKPALIEAFRTDEESCLFATLGFFQGVDVPGRALSLVTIDRLPFPRPDEPLLQARRERARADAFRLVDLPRAATLLAQGAGRLIRTATDRGVVAVLDPRLATATRYRWDIVRALPPMRRTRHRHEAESFLRELRDA
jgi:ATP-dependent DNA helicase DinG